MAVTELEQKKFEGTQRENKYGIKVHWTDGHVSVHWFKNVDLRDEMAAAFYDKEDVAYVEVAWRGVRTEEHAGRARHLREPAPPRLRQPEGLPVPLAERGPETVK